MVSAVVSAVVLSWRRQHNLPAILSSLRSWNRVGEVVVWNNDPEFILTDHNLPEATVYNSGRNLYFLPRYLLVPTLRHAAVLFHDDDVLLTPEQLEAIYASLALNSLAISGPRGRNLTGDDRLLTNGIAYGVVDVVCGMASMFTKALYAQAWPRVMAYLSERPTSLFEDDLAFSLAATAATGNRHYAVNVEPIVGLGTQDRHAAHRVNDYSVGRRAAIAHFTTGGRR